jgi:hypothetical protein
VVKLLLESNVVVIEVLVDVTVKAVFQGLGVMRMIVVMQ